MPNTLYPIGYSDELAKLAAQYKIQPLTTEVVVVSQIAKTTAISWTAVDISAYVSTKASAGYFRGRLGCSVIPAGSWVIFYGRPNGEVHTYYPEFSIQQKAGYAAGGWSDMTLIIGLDSTYKFQYSTAINAGPTYDLNLILLGYIE